MISGCLRRGEHHNRVRSSQPASRPHPLPEQHTQDGRARADLSAGGGAHRRLLLPWQRLGHPSPADQQEHPPAHLLPHRLSGGGRLPGGQRGHPAGHRGGRTVPDLLLRLPLHQLRGHTADPRLGFVSDGHRCGPLPPRLRPSEIQEDGDAQTLVLGGAGVLAPGAAAELRPHAGLEQQRDPGPSRQRQDPLRVRGRHPLRLPHLLQLLPLHLDAAAGDGHALRLHLRHHSQEPEGQTRQRHPNQGAELPEEGAGPGRLPVPGAGLVRAVLAPLAHRQQHPVLWGGHGARPRLLRGHPALARQLGHQPHHLRLQNTQDQVRLHEDLEEAQQLPRGQPRIAEQPVHRQQSEQQQQSGKQLVEPLAAFRP